MSSQSTGNPVTSGTAARTSRHRKQTPSVAQPRKTVSIRGKKTASAIAKPGPRTTKQELVLTLLSRKDGATIEEIMAATGWQQHSVRGFFAETVKKKLGFELISSRNEDEVRRYRIEKGAGGC